VARRRPEFTLVAGVEELLRDPEAAWTLDEGRARALLPRVAALHAILATRLSSPRLPPAEGSGKAPAGPPERPGGTDDLLTVGELAEMLKKSKSAVYRLLRREDLKPARVKVDRRTLLAKRAELMKLLELAGDP